VTLIFGSSLLLGYVKKVTTPQPVLPVLIHR